VLKDAPHQRGDRPGQFDEPGEDAAPGVIILEQNFHLGTYGLLKVG
jgi:hypothetical protein